MRASFFNQIDWQSYTQVVEEVETELRHVLGSRVALVEQVNRHTLDAGGKRLRPAFVTLSAEATGLPFDRLRATRLGACMELIHMATLIHDDVIDETSQRRGRATASSAFGNTVSVLSGDVCLAKAMGILAEDGDLVIIRRVARVVEQMAEGEVREIEIRGDFDLDRTRHFEILSMKTAEFIGCCCEVGARIAGADPEVQGALRNFGFEVGMAFQMIDDVLDYDGLPEQTGKPLGTDFREGCATLPLIELRERVAGERIDFARRSFGNGVLESDVEALVALMRETRVLENVRHEAAESVGRAIQHLESLPESPARELLATAAQLIVERQS